MGPPTEELHAINDALTALIRKVQGWYWPASVKRGRPLCHLAVDGVAVCRRTLVLSGGPYFSAKVTASNGRLMEKPEGDVICPACEEFLDAIQEGASATSWPRWRDRSC